MPRTCHDLLPGESFPDKPEIADYEQAKIDALAYIASLGITAEIKCRGVDETQPEGKDETPWLHFKWDCVAINRKAIHQPSANLDDYKTGIGNSTFKEHNWRHGPAPCSGNVQVEQFARTGQLHRFKERETRIDGARHYLKPKSPDIADILGSYAMDYVDANNAGSFEDWALEFGYDTDSRKAEDIYRACLAQRKPLLALGLSMAEIEKIAEYASQF